jgi:hypothetical protein
VRLLQRTADSVHHLHARSGEVRNRIAAAEARVAAAQQSRDDRELSGPASTSAAVQAAQEAAEAAEEAAAEAELAAAEHALAALESRADADEAHAVARVSRAAALLEESMALHSFHAGALSVGAATAYGELADAVAQVFCTAGPLDYGGCRECK